MDRLPRLGKRELICLLLFTCNYVVSVWRGFLFIWVLGMGYVILLWHSLGLPYNYFDIYWLPTSKSQKRLHSFLTSHVMHMKAFVTFVHAGLDGTTRLSFHFRTRKHSWNLFQQNRNTLLIKSKSFWKT